MEDLNTRETDQMFPEKSNVSRQKDNDSLDQNKRRFTNFTIFHTRTQSSDLNPLLLGPEGQHKGPDDTERSDIVTNVIDLPKTGYLLDQRINDALQTENNLADSSENSIFYGTNSRILSNDRSNYFMLMGSEFKPSNLYKNAERRSRERKEDDKIHAIKSHMEEKHLTESNQNEDVKTTTVNLMDLIKNYTKQPNLEQKIKLNKSSFLKTMKGSRNESNKENHTDLYNVNMINTVSAKKNGKKASVPNSVLTDCSLNSSAQKPSQRVSRFNSKLVNSALKTPSKTNNISRSQSGNKSGEKSNQRRSSQPVVNNTVHLGSQIRGLSSTNKKRFMTSMTNNISSLLSVNESMHDNSILEASQQQIISILKETVQKLVEKTESNKQEIRKLQQIKEVEATKEQVNRAKLTSLVQYNVRA